MSSFELSTKANLTPDLKPDRCLDLLYAIAETPRSSSLFSPQWKATRNGELILCKGWDLFIEKLKGIFSFLGFFNRTDSTLVRYAVIQILLKAKSPIHLFTPTDRSSINQAARNVGIALEASIENKRPKAALFAEAVTAVTESLFNPDDTAHQTKAHEKVQQLYKKHQRTLKKLFKHPTLLNTHKITPLTEQQSTPQDPASSQPELKLNQPFPTLFTPVPIDNPLVDERTYSEKRDDSDTCSPEKDAQENPFHASTSDSDCSSHSNPDDRTETLQHSSPTDSSEIYLPLDDILKTHSSLKAEASPPMEAIPESEFTQKPPVTCRPNIIESSSTFTEPVTKGKRATRPSSIQSWWVLAGKIAAASLSAFALKEAIHTPYSTGISTIPLPITPELGSEKPAFANSSEYTGPWASLDETSLAASDQPCYDTSNFDLFDRSKQPKNAHSVAPYNNFYSKKQFSEIFNDWNWQCSFLEAPQPPSINNLDSRRIVLLNQPSNSNVTENCPNPDLLHSSPPITNQLPKSSPVVTQQPQPPVIPLSTPSPLSASDQPESNQESTTSTRGGRSAAAAGSLLALTTFSALFELRRQVKAFSKLIGRQLPQTQPPYPIRPVPQPVHPLTGPTVQSNQLTANIKITPDQMHVIIDVSQISRKKLSKLMSFFMNTKVNSCTHREEGAQSFLTLEIPNKEKLASGNYFYLLNLEKVLASFSPSAAHESAAAADFRNPLNNIPSQTATSPSFSPWHFLALGGNGDAAATALLPTSPVTGRQNTSNEHRSHIPQHRLPLIGPKKEPKNPKQQKTAETQNREHVASAAKASTTSPQDDTQAREAEAVAKAQAQEEKAAKKALKKKIDRNEKKRLAYDARNAKKLAREARRDGNSTAKPLSEAENAKKEKEDLKVKRKNNAKAKAEKAKAAAEAEKNRIRAAELLNSYTTLYEKLIVEKELLSHDLLMRTLLANAADAAQADAQYAVRAAKHTASSAAAKPDSEVPKRMTSPAEIAAKAIVELKQARTNYTDTLNDAKEAILAAKADILNTNAETAISSVSDLERLISAVKSAEELDDAVTKVNAFLTAAEKALNNVDHLSLESFTSVVNAAKKLIQAAQNLSVANTAAEKAHEILAEQELRRNHEDTAANNSQADTILQFSSSGDDSFTSRRTFLSSSATVDDAAAVDDAAIDATAAAADDPMAEPKATFDQTFATFKAVLATTKRQDNIPKEQIEALTKARNKVVNQGNHLTQALMTAQSASQQANQAAASAEQELAKLKKQRPPFNFFASKATKNTQAQAIAAAKAQVIATQAKAQEAAIAVKESEKIALAANKALCDIAIETHLIVARRENQEDLKEFQQLELLGFDLKQATLLLAGLKVQFANSGQEPPVERVSVEQVKEALQKLSGTLADEKTKQLVTELAIFAAFPQRYNRTLLDVITYDRLCLFVDALKNNSEDLLKKLDPHYFNPQAAAIQKLYILAHLILHFNENEDFFISSRKNHNYSMYSQGNNFGWTIGEILTFHRKLKTQLAP